jgi:hypothetical protein
MGTSETQREIRSAITDIDAGISELDNVKSLIAMEASRASSEFDSGQDFSTIITGANNSVDSAIAELKKAKASLEGVASALR